MEIPGITSSMSGSLRLAMAAVPGHTSLIIPLVEKPWIFKAERRKYRHSMVCSMDIPEMDVGHGQNCELAMVNSGS